MTQASYPGMEDGIEELEEKVAKQRKQYKLSDFVYDASEERYWDKEALVSYSKDAVNALVPQDEWEQQEVPGRNNSVRLVSIKPSSSIARVERDSVVEGNTWWPGKPRIIEDIIVTDSGDVRAKGRRILNTYIEPHLGANGNPKMALPWVNHVKTLWPDDYEILLDYFAHLIQKPHEKANYGIILLGAPGIGKDTALEPVRWAMSERNCREISPDLLFTSYNSYADSLLLVINEARPTEHEFKATDFYEKMKVLCAAPPDWITINGKYERQRYVRNLMRVIITTNDALSIYIPEDDRRLHFAQSKLPQGWHEEGYFTHLYEFFNAGGNAHVIAHLRERDISKFNPKQKPKANAAWSNVSAAWHSPVSSPLADIVDDLGWPDVFFGNELLQSEVAAFDNKDDMRQLLRSSLKLAREMSKLGYETIRAEDKATGWLWSVDGKRFKARVAFVKKSYAGDVKETIDARGKEIAERGKAMKNQVPRFKTV